MELKPADSVRYAAGDVVRLLHRPPTHLYNVFDEVQGGVRILPRTPDNALFPFVSDMALEESLEVFLHHEVAPVACRSISWPRRGDRFYVAISGGRLALVLRVNMESSSSICLARADGNPMEHIDNFGKEHIWMFPHGHLESFGAGDVVRGTKGLIDGRVGRVVEINSEYPVGTLKYKGKHPQILHPDARSNGILKICWDGMGSELDFYPTLFPTRVCPWDVMKHSELVDPGPMAYAHTGLVSDAPEIEIDVENPNVAQTKFFVEDG